MIQIKYTLNKVVDKIYSGVIDYSVYIKVPLSSPSTEEKDSEDNNMAAILDQKNYLEELNRHLNSSVNNLQQKVASLQTSNTILKGITFVIFVKSE